MKHSLLTLSHEHCPHYLSEELHRQLCEDARRAVDYLRRATPDAPHLGWIDWPTLPLIPTLLNQISTLATHLRNQCQYIICIGVGGSYLGGRAMIEALAGHMADFRTAQVGQPKILFAGQNLSSSYLYDLIALIGDAPCAMVYTSKSGTTTEPAIAFQILKQRLFDRLPADLARDRIVVITDPDDNSLHGEATQHGYHLLHIPANIGGRFSALTPAGLMTLALAGIDAAPLLDGARHEAELYAEAEDPLELPIVRYAMHRQGLYRIGYKTEIFASFEPQLNALGAWWTQLFGESEGKEHRGILPIPLHYPTDLHAMGQWVQQGERSIFETILRIGDRGRVLSLPIDIPHDSPLHYLAGKNLAEIQDQALFGTLLAHSDGQVPTLLLQIETLSPQCIGAWIYAMQYAVAVSGLMMGVNPFDQPGVEEYKRNMYALLGRPGYLDLSAKLYDRLSQAHYSTPH